MNLKMLVMASASALALGVSAPAFAQDAAPAPAPVPEQDAAPAPAPAPEGAPEAEATEPMTPMEAPSSAEISDETLQSFARAFLEVAEISQEYQPQLESAETPEDQEQVRTEAGEEMIQAVEAVDGIGVEEYQQILQAAQADPELAQRINTQIAQFAE